MKNRFYLNSNLEINLGINRIEDGKFYSPMIIVRHNEGDIVFKCDAIFKDQEGAESFLAHFVVAFRQGQDQAGSKLFPQ